MMIQYELVIIDGSPNVLYHVVIQQYFKVNEYFICELLIKQDIFLNEDYLNFMILNLLIDELYQLAHLHMDFN